MSDPVTMARSARERLAQGLGALQAPGIPAALLGVAEPIAQAMSALHQIESTRGGAGAQVAAKALDGVRRALGALQGDASGHPAVQQATEAVASSLGLVHGLSTALAAPAHPAPQAAPAAPHVAFAGTLVADAGAVGAPPTQPSGRVPQYAQPAAAPQWAAPPQQAVPQQQWAAPQQAAPQQWAAPQQAAPQQQAAAPQRAQPAAQPRAAGPGASGLPRVDAELGVHSTTNFYKGLSSNDIIESGGIFVATYQIPPIGRELMIHVTMPGGYEFEARGIVRWTREAPLSAQGGTESPPGYGAQFLDITPEARQLVNRYVRNREPLFHDDL